MPDITTAPVAEQTAPAEASTDSDAAKAAEVESLTAQFKAGLATYGRDKPALGGLKRHAKAAPADDKTADQAVEAEAKAEPAQPTPEPAPTATPKPPETPLEQQRRLSAGFAKLARQQRSIEARESALKEVEQRLTVERDKALEAHKAAESKAAEVKEVADALDADDVALLDLVAKRRGTTRQAVFDRVTRAMLAGGKLDPADLKADFDKRLADVEAKSRQAMDDKLAEQKSEAEKAKGESERQAALRKQAQSEASGFASWVKGPAVGEDGAPKYPLLAAEDPADISKAVTRVVADYGRRHPGKQLTYDQVARRVLDAQHFGIPQRRRRVFIVGKRGEDSTEPAEILFNSQSCRGRAS